MGLFDDDNDSRRTLSRRDKEILYVNANHKCQNCGKTIFIEDLEIGHKTAWSRGGRTTLKNSVCLCHACNRLQGTDSWTTFQKKQGKTNPKTDLKNTLDSLNLRQLKFLAKLKHVKIKGQIEEGLFEDHRSAPTKKQYVNKLSGIVSTKEINALPSEPPKIKKRRRSRNDSWF